MKFYAFALIVLLSAFAEAADPDAPVENPTLSTDADKDFNKMLDEIIKATITKHKKDITPYELEDRKITFQKKIVLVNVTGAIGFDNITLHGLENIKRAGDSYLSKTKYGNTEMSVKLLVGPLSLKADGLVSFLGLTSRSSYEINLENVVGSGVLHFYPKTEEISIKSFDMGKLNGLQFKITKCPLIFTPFVVNQVSRAMIAVYRPIIKLAVERTASMVLISAVRESAFLKDIMTNNAQK